MATTTSNQLQTTFEDVTLWTGRILSGLCLLFLLVDALMTAGSLAAVHGTAGLGFSDTTVAPLRLLILSFTVLYCISCTPVFGAVLLTAHPGGAVAIFIRQFPEQPYFLFPLVFCVLLWAGLYLGNKNLRSIIPITRRDG
jgi:hypothetical protein